jgi:hypothetical protein
MSEIKEQRKSVAAVPLETRKQLADLQPFFLFPPEGRLPF